MFIQHIGWRWKYPLLFVYAHHEQPTHTAVQTLNFNTACKHSCKRKYFCYVLDGTELRIMAFIHVFPNQIATEHWHELFQNRRKKPKYIKPHFTYCLHYKLALGAREDMMCGMFHFMTFQSGAFCFDAMQIFILQPTEGNPNRHSYELRCYLSRTFLKLLYFNHGTIVMWKLSASAFSRHSTIYTYVK